ncbi:MAG: DUF89 family protein [Deltaproteobacteria bacterium]|nr:DUF89 family protein [Deltaproteobacteria bacterium]NIS77565.1 DUF89 family protein [Deltaproteobacteria bacterium]
MIRVNPDCYACFLRQVETACRQGGLTEAAALRSLSRAARYIGSISADDVPARVASRLHAIVREASGVADPFDDVKREQKKRFRETYSKVRAKVDERGEGVEAAVLLAGAGNMYDFGIISEGEAERFFGDMDALTRGVYEIDHFMGALARAKVVGMLLDNTGEAPFDLVLAERLMDGGIEVWFGVKGGPVIDDITYSDALELGLDENIRVVSNGSQAVGTDLGDVSAEFLDMLHKSDLVISKGQANFETLYGSLENCFFLFVCKCPVVEKITRADYGSVMLMADRVADEAGKNRGISQFK